MDTKQTLFASGEKMAAFGSLIWSILLGGVLLNNFRLSIFDLLFLLAPWVVVPLALSLVPAAQGDWFSRISTGLIRYLLFPGALLGTVGFFLASGRTAGAMTCLWFLVAMFLAMDGVARLIRTRLRSFQEFCFAAGEGYALVGALWLLASRRATQDFVRRHRRTLASLRRPPGGFASRNMLFARANPKGFAALRALRLARPAVLQGLRERFVSSLKGALRT